MKCAALERTPDEAECKGCSESDYDYLRQLVLTHSSNLIDPSHNALFDSRLKPVAQLAGASTLEEFVGLLRVDRTAQLHSAVAEAMTINETSFFRDRRMFEALRETILPRLIEANRATRSLRIWSAACSTGQEAYSVAMTICEHFPELSAWDVKIAGTDISRQVIEQARLGRYRRMDVDRGLPARKLVSTSRAIAKAGRSRRVCVRCVSSKWPICALRCRRCRCSIWCFCATCCSTFRPQDRGSRLPRRASADDAGRLSITGRRLSRRRTQPTCSRPSSSKIATSIGHSARG